MKNIKQDNREIKIKDKLNCYFQKDFDKKVKDLYLFSFWYRSKPTKYLEKLWDKGNYTWRVGEIVPLYAKKSKIGWYKITKCDYGSYGNSSSDWAFGDDGKYRDFKLVKITKV